jgi:hypothetical protein
MARVVPAAFGRVAGAATAGMVLVTGCSAAADLADTAGQSVTDLSELSDKALRRQITEEVDGAHSVRLTIDLRRNGYEAHTDMYLDMDTDDYRNVAESPGLTLETISVGPDVYVKAPRSYWWDLLGRDREDLVASLDGKYGHVAADDSARSKLATVAKTANPHAIVDILGETERRTDSVIDGRRMVVLAESDEVTMPALLYIPSAGPALPFRMSSIGSEPGRGSGAEEDEDSVSMTWSEYNRPVDIKAPAGDLVVELPNLGTAPKGL